ncbi:hypothetical protein NIES593_17775 [Hydrococcus rivularis NIES-593]|uniref:Orc1-like AAA ATPase domain-containing protein n=1 Tax=Hydrococcus rivularis NIES-593 TaxID=1921803 RepID=A0A1U7HAU9_9CYAN|nr:MULTISPECIES: hypothetical protein [Cyanophyceae]MBE9003968.1 hypothetical protein [Fortiea sp. LEGE XX443]OKH20703.1 hypothetical protein NIES593_17775 [Hydrococcus rivularis NIES-593]
MQLSNRTLLANFTKELAFFQQMVNGENSARILLLEAPPGYGKTKLISKLIDITKEYNSSKSKVITIDLKTVIDVPYLFNDICEVIGVDFFPNFTTCITNLLNSQTANISDNKTLGSLNVQIIQTVLDENKFTQANKLIKLQESFLHDLGNLNQQLIFFLDTFETVGTDLGTWIDGVFLKAVVHKTNWLVVIAGQKVPSLDNIIWGNQAEKICLDLELINCETEWYKFSQSVGWPFSQDAIKMLIRVLKGKSPKLIRESLEVLAKDWEK